MYAIDHCLFFTHPEKEIGTLYLSGQCLERHRGESITIDIFEGDHKIGSLSPRLDQHDDSGRNTNDPVDLAFHAYLQTDKRLDDGIDVKLEFKNQSESFLDVTQKVTGIHDYFSSHIDSLGISEIKKSKLTNLLLNETERIHHIKGVESSPIYLLIGPSWLCNLDCHCCQVNAMRKAGYSSETMDNEIFQKILERFGEKMVMASLTNGGEPFLNENIAEYIRALKAYEIHVTIGSHFNIQFSEGDIDNIVLSGLDHITAFLDGATQESYAKYRQAGSLNLALENIQKIIKKKRDHHKETPRIQWQFQLFEWNSHEVEMARKMSVELGFDEFEVKKGDVSMKDAPSLELRDNSFMDSMKPDIRNLMAKYCNERNENKQYFGCDHLYHQMVVNADGSVHPCCHTHELNHLFGFVQSKKDIFNVALYKNARGLFSKYPANECQGYDPCLNCWIVTDDEHKGYVSSALDFFSAYEIITGQPLTV